MTSILNPRFRYTNSLKTDIRKTFAKVRREQKRQQKQEQPPAEVIEVTVPSWLKQP